MTVKELRELLSSYPDDMLVKVATIDGNAYCHEDPAIKMIDGYTLSLPNERGWGYATVEQRVLEIS